MVIAPQQRRNSTSGEWLREAPYEKKFLNYEFFPNRGGGVPIEPKVLRHFLVALKQSKANKCQCAKRLKTVKKNFLKFLLNNFGKK